MAVEACTYYPVFYTYVNADECEVQYARGYRTEFVTE